MLMMLVLGAVECVSTRMRLFTLERANFKAAVNSTEAYKFNGNYFNITLVLDTSSALF